MGLVVNGQTIEDRLVQQEAERLRSAHDRAFPDMDVRAREDQLQEWARENVIEQVLLEQHARTLGIDVPEEQVEATLAEVGPEGLAALRARYPDEKALREGLRSRLRVSALISQIHQTAAKPSKPQIRRYYEEHLDEFRLPERVHAAHIVKQVDWRTDESQARAAIQAAKAELDEGSPFEWVAERHSDHPQRGGSLGYIQRGQMVEEFEDVVFNLGIGQVSGIFRTRGGFHLATVYDRRPPEIQALDRVHTLIETRLSEQFKADALFAFIDLLKHKAL